MLLFCLISKTNLIIMSIKPSVVFIKGVHSTTGSDKTSDIGFPQLELEKLFEGAASKKVGSGGTYSSGKKYIYYDPSNSQVVIRDEGHFNCIKNGYYSIADGVNHYYTLSDNNYNYNTVPNISSWTDKWSFSNTIKDKTLYSISPESDRICVDNNTYYKKNGNNYVKQDVLTYNTYDDSIYVNWNNEYIGETTLDETTFKDITVWKTNSGTIATSGYYLSYDAKPNGTYIVQLLNLTFNAGVYSGNIIFDALYKLSSDFNFQDSVFYYVKNGNNFEGLKVNQDQCTFTTDPTTDNNFYIYQKGADWSYPNTTGPEYSILTGTDGIYDSDNFPLYTNATIAKITKTPHESYTVYEKTAVKINYNYSDDANSLKFIFTDKDIDGVLEACNLPNDIKKYVHLTNLKYNK